jgi:sigma-B regulation protein RsbU (phosphoserine phosphatase)
MHDALASGEIDLEVNAPGAPRRLVPITHSPFLIGRGVDPLRDLQLSDSRISRQCAAILCEDGRYYLEDRGQRHGVFLNGAKISKHELTGGDSITFGVEGSYELIFRPSVDDRSIPALLDRMQHMTTGESSPGGLHKLSLLLEATALLHSRVPLASVLNTMLDNAITVTNAERGLLLEAGPSGSLRVRVARRGGGRALTIEGIVPSQTALRMAMERRAGVVTEDLAREETDLQAAQSIVAQGIRTVVAIPLYSVSRANSDESAIAETSADFLGILYLDSRRPAAFSQLDRKILHALAVEAASILDNARLVERERERQLLEHEIGIARDIQQALLPRGLRDFPHMAISGTNLPCLAVGGDYFDVFPLGQDRTAFLIADVSGKGLGAALLTTMLQGALSGLTLGAEAARVFSHLNRFLCEHTDVGHYATMFFGVLSPSGELDFINAGHPSPFLLSGGKVSEPFGEGSFPVGLIPEAEYSSARVQLQPGDTLVLFSDGVTEAADVSGEMFGLERFREVLEAKSGASLEPLQMSVLHEVQRFSSGAGQADDITLLLVRYRPSNAT